MQLASQHFTLIIGIDVHFTTLPPFNPLHPFIGLVIDPMDYVPFVGGTVYINGHLRGVSDTSGMMLTWKHFPLFTGPFALMPLIGHESVNFFGSVNTYVDGSRLSPTGHMVMSYNDIGIPLSLQPGKKFEPIPSLFAPTSVSIPLSSGAPVFVGGPYVPDLEGALKNMAMSYGFGGLMKAGGALAKKAQKHLNDKAAHLMSKRAENLDKMAGKWDSKPQSGKTGFLNQPRMSRAELQAFKEKMGKVGVDVEIDRKGRLPEEVRAGFVASEKKIYLRKGATQYEAFHEGKYAEQWANLGEEAYPKQTRLQKETYVYNEIMKSKQFSTEEVDHATRYINRLRKLEGLDSL